MALFKILKGSNKDLFTTPKGQENNPDHPSKKTVQGYCYFTPDNGKFYIDVADSEKVTLGTNRICLNAARSDISNATNYGECSTNGGEQIKTVTIDNFKLVKGARILIKFANANTYVSTATKPLKLSINGEDPIPLTIRGKTESTTAVNMSNS